jgi:uncharacterized protein
MNKRGLFISFVLLLVLATSGYSQEISASGFVNDYANVITPEYRTQIDSVLKELYDKDIAQMSVVTIDSLNGQDIESYAINLVQGKLGTTGKNNGLLLLIVVNDRQYRFEVGRGLEAQLNDARVGRIGRMYLQPNFRTGNYGKGIYDASLQVRNILSTNTTQENGGNAQVTIQQNVRYIIFLIAILFIIATIAISTRMIDKENKVKDKYFNAALMAGMMFGRGGRGGFGGGGFGGGGFGGFGGGGFSGGGASGRW